MPVAKLVALMLTLCFGVPAMAHEPAIYPIHMTALSTGGRAKYPTELSFSTLYFDPSEQKLQTMATQHKPFGPGNIRGISLAILSVAANPPKRFEVRLHRTNSADSQSGTSVLSEPIPVRAPYTFAKTFERGELSYSDLDTLMFGLYIDNDGDQVQASLTVLLED